MAGWTLSLYLTVRVHPHDLGFRAGPPKPLASNCNPLLPHEGEAADFGAALSLMARTSIVALPHADGDTLTTKSP